MQVAIEPAKPHELPALEAGLALLNRSDAFVSVALSEETGEWLLGAAGEIHLEMCVKDLQVRFSLTTKGYAYKAPRSAPGPLQRKDMITKQQHSLRQRFLKPGPSVIPDCLPQSEHPPERTASRPGTNAAPEARTTSLKARQYLQERFADQISSL